MAIDSYSSLQTAVENWLARDDLTSRVPEFIDLAEARMNRVIYPTEAEKRATRSTSDGDAYLSLPNDCRYVRTVKLNTDPVTILRYQAPDHLRWYYASAGDRKPRGYTILGRELQLSPTPDDAYTVEITYVRGIPALTDSNTSNDMLDRHPDAYLYGSLAEAHRYLMDEQRAQYYAQLFNSAMEDARLEEERTRYPQGLTMRSDYIGWRGDT